MDKNTVAKKIISYCVTDFRTSGNTTFYGPSLYETIFGTNITEETFTEAARMLSRRGELNILFADNAAQGIELPMSTIKKYENTTF